MYIQLFELLGASFLFVTTLMILLWIVATLKNNAGIVDIGWALSFFVMMMAYLTLGEGFWLKRILISIMVSAWSLRLTWHLLQRFDLTIEDPRYQTLKSKLGPEAAGFKMFVVFIFQGFLTIVLSTPFLIVAAYSTSEWYLSEAIGVLVWAAGFVGEFYADQQLDRFKKKPENKRKVCNVGLWKLSRHPNYFFEWIIWIGFFLFAWPSPLGILAIVSPVLMLLLLTRISGIPLAEEQSLKTKGDAYKEYQDSTSCFVPLPPKKSEVNGH